MIYFSGTGVFCHLGQYFDSPKIKKPPGKPGGSEQTEYLGRGYRRNLEAHLGIGNAQRTQLQIDAGAGLCIRARVVVVKVYAKIRAHTAELF